MDYSKRCKYSIRLLEKLESLDILQQLDFNIINKAIYWAKKYHDGQYRKSGEPFYSHPLEVAYMISDHLLQTSTIVASILHDIVEDTEVTIGMILDEFGWRIAEMVDRLTRDRPDGTKLSIAEILNNAYENNDTEVLLIKVIDRLHNIDTIGCKSKKKQIETCLETSNNIIAVTTVFNNLDLEKLLSEKVLSILHDKEECNMIMRKKYSLLSVLDSYQPPLPFVQNKISHI